MILSLFAKKRVCPFCFEDFNYREAPFRCKSPASVCSPEPDPTYERHWADATLPARVIPVAGGATEVRCPGCHYPTRKRICPLCHMDLPLVLEEMNPRVIAIIGGADSGKSHYIAVMMHRFQNYLGPRLHVQMQAANDQTIRRFAQDFHDPVFRRKHIIAKTQSGLQKANAVRIPLIFSVTVGGEGWMGGRSIRSATCLVFYDTAGEDMKREDVLSTVNRYICRAEGIILLLDPLQMQSVRLSLPQGTGIPDQTHDAGEVVNRTVRLIRDARRLSESTQINTPIAVALSKFDAIRDLVDPQSVLRTASDHSRGFDHEDQQAVTSEVKELIGNWEYGGLLQQVEFGFRENAFFAVSALGCNPHGTDAVPHVLPHRVEDPLVWLLHLQGLIPDRRS